MKVLVDADAKTSTGKTQPDGSGGTARGIDQVIAYERNVKGEVTEMKRDNNVDGTYDYREAYTLNANGGRTEKYIDLTNDGTFDRKEVYTKEADDGLVKTKFYNLVEGREVLTKVEDYTLNANNQRTSVKVDTLGDGSINAITTYELDALGRTAKAYFDTNGDGTVDRVEAYTRDTNGHILRNEISNADGEIQTIRTYVRNTNGYMIESFVDNGADGIVDLHYIYTSDVYGNEITQTRYSYNDVTGNLELTSTAERVYNALGQVEKEEFVGIAESYTTEYTYDDYGRSISQLYTGDYMNRRWDFTYNDDGTIKERKQYSLDGTLENTIVYVEYYSENQLSKVVETYDVNGELSDISKYLRNENGNILNTLRDLASNGIGSWDYFNFGDRGRGSSFNTSIDFTNWSEEQLAELGSSITRIAMGNGSVSQLTLNAEVVAQISEGGLRVLGASDSNDVLNLSGFEKSATSDMRGYDLYTASVNGEDLNLYVQANDTITVNIIG